MKKVILIAAMFFAGLFTYCYGQDVKVNINNQDYSSNKDCEYKINGICSSEDIGGVEIRGIKKYIKENDGYDSYHADYSYAILTNYNKTTVSVMFEIFSQGGVYTTVLRENETKEVLLFTRRAPYKPSVSSESWNVPLKGMIVRKVGQ